MDPLSVAASVAGVATLAADLSKTLYTVYSDAKGAEKETEEIARDVSILSTVLEEMETVLRNASQTYRPNFVEKVKEISDRCERIFKDIEKATGVKRGKASKKSLLRKIAWCFQKDHVKQLQISLESLKSTLNILLHVPQLAHLIVGVANGAPDPVGDKKVSEERQLVTSLVMENRLLVEKLGVVEVESQEGLRQVRDHAVEYSRRLAGQKQLHRHVEGEEQRALLSCEDSIDGAHSKISIGPSESTHQDRDHGRRTPLHARVSDGDLTINEQGPKTEPRLSVGPPSRTNESERSGNIAEAYSALVEAYKLMIGLDYSLQTSRLLAGAIPHESVDDANPQSHAERVVDLLLGRYTNVSVERNVYNSPRHNPRHVESYTREPTTYVDPQREIERFGGELIPVGEMVENMTFHRIAYMKLEEQNRNLEQELRFERAKEQIRQETLASVKAEQKSEAESRATVENSKPLTLRDCLGRSFSFPIQACRSWQTMRSLITSSFLHIEALSPQIAQGSYDLLGPSGDIILPEVWETMVQPGWVVELRLRPQPGAAHASLSPGFATPKSSPGVGSKSDDSIEIISSGFRRPSLRGLFKGPKSWRRNAVEEVEGNESLF